MIEFVKLFGTSKYVTQVVISTGMFNFFCTGIFFLIDRGIYFIPVFIKKEDQYFKIIDKFNGKTKNGKQRDYGYFFQTQNYSVDSLSIQMLSPRGGRVK